MDAVVDFISQQPYVVFGIAAAALVVIACAVKTSPEEVAAVPLSQSQKPKEGAKKGQGGSKSYAAVTAAPVAEAPAVQKKVIVPTPIKPAAVKPAAASAAKAVSAPVAKAAPAPVAVAAPAKPQQTSSQPSKPKPTAAKASSKPGAKPAAKEPAQDSYETDDVWDPSAGRLHAETAAVISKAPVAAVAASVASSATTAADLDDYSSPQTDMGGNWNTVPAARRRKVPTATE